MNDAKQKWIEIVNHFIDKAVYLISYEHQLLSIAEDTDDDDIQELDTIRKLVLDLKDTVSEDIQDIEDVDDVYDYWPPLLLPRPF